MALDQPSHSNDMTPDGGHYGMFDSKPAPEKGMLAEVEDTIDKHVLGGGMSAYGDLIGAGKNNIHNDAAEMRDPKGDLAGLDFGKGNDLMSSINERNKLGHVGLYSLMSGNGDKISEMAGNVAEKKLMANV